MGLDMSIMINGEPVITMRKANAIRRWFSENLKDFNDNGTTRVSKEDIEDICAAMRAVITSTKINEIYTKYYEKGEVDRDSIFEDINNFIENEEEYEKFRSFAEENFPSQSGFFFGSIEYDAWYIYDLCEYYQAFSALSETIAFWEDAYVEYWEWY